MIAKRVLLGMVLMLMLTLTLLVPFNTYAAIENYKFPQADMAPRFNDLTNVLRCPKCQNQSLADSDSIIAKDLRAQVQNLLIQGQTNEQIIQYMVQRYGDFILYDPAFNKSTLVLWLAPVGMLFIGLWVLWYFGRKTQIQATMLTPEEQAQLNRLLAQDERQGTDHD